MSVVLAATGTHLFPGATGTARGRLAPGDCLVEFADGAAAPGRIEAAGAGLVLHLAAHTTARGTRIEAKSWQIEPQQRAARFRIAGRAP